MWRIWYADGSTYSSDDGPPESVPAWGVQVIAQPDRRVGVGNVSYLTLSGYDWYFWHTEDKEWAGAAGDTSMWDLILHREPITGICQGRRVSYSRYEAIRSEASTWAQQMGLPRKSGNRSEETRW